MAGRLSRQDRREQRRQDWQSRADRNDTRQAGSGRADRPTNRDQARPVDRDRRGGGPDFDPSLRGPAIPPARAEQFAGLRGEALARATRDLQGEGQTMSYDTVRRVMFGDVWDRDGDDVIREVYENRELRTTTTPDAGGPDGTNTEHITPRSDGVRGTRYETNLFNIAPSDTEINGLRSSFPFGDPVTVEQRGPSGWEFGRDEAGRQVFMPPPEIRGDIARARFWVENERGGDFPAHELATLKRWADEDPVSEDERARDELASQYEGERQYFADLSDAMPGGQDLEDLIWPDSGAPAAP